MDSNHTCLAVSSLDFCLNKNGTYYPEVFSKECKYINKRVSRHSVDDTKNSSHNSDEE